jgi:hypothetical protein
MPDFGIMRGFNEKLFGDKLYAGQLPTQLGLIGSQEVINFDPDAQAFFDRVTAAGGTLSATEKTAVDTLVKQMKLDGTWTPMKAIYPMVGASAAACAQNLKSSSFTGTFTAGWTFASTGITPNGTSAYMSTGLIPSTDTSQDSVSIGVYSRTNNTTLIERIEIGSGTTSFLEISIRWNSSLGNLSKANNGFAGSGYIPTKTSGFFTISRTGSALVKKYENGQLKENLTTLSISPSTLQLTIGARNTTPSPLFYDSKENAFSYISDGLSDTESSNFYTAVQAFQTTLNRQV